MPLPGFNDQVAAMDAKLIDAFGIEIQLLLANPRIVKAIFDNPSQLHKVANGFIADTDPVITLKTTDAQGINKNDAVMVAGDHYRVADHPHHDGTGLTELSLTKTIQSSDDYEPVQY